jgi:leucyl aminopeptidase
MKYEFKRSKASIAPCIVVVTSSQMTFTPALKKLDEALGGMITQLLKSKQFQGKNKETLQATAMSKAGLHRVVLYGIGKDKLNQPNHWTYVGGQLIPAMQATKQAKADLYINLENFAIDEAEVFAQIALGMQLRGYRFDHYRTKLKDDEKPKLEHVTLMSAVATEAEVKFTALQALHDGITFARNVVSEPPNVLYPASMAERCLEMKSLGLEVEVLGEKEMRKLGMGALLGVAQGSRQEPKLIVLRWNGGKDGTAPVAFVGKGVTFDTGGISIKPSGGMEDMKYDMAGSAVVAGVMRTLAARGAKVNAVGIMGMVENMPDGNAQRPSDVVTSMSGQTIAVLNTDAEGRLVLADALWYCQEKFKPKFIVDLATLTGAMVVALGTEYAGLFSNNANLTTQLKKAGDLVNEKLWPFPMHDAYDRAINSPIADVQNISNEKGGGSITAAKFLQRFIKDETPWAHLDIAGVAWATRDCPVCPKGATGFGVRLLDQLVADNYEE